MIIFTLKLKLTVKIVPGRCEKIFLTDDDKLTYRDTYNTVVLVRQLRSFLFSSSISGRGLSLVSGNISDRKPAVMDADPNTTYGRAVGVPS